MVLIGTLVLVFAISAVRLVVKTSRRGVFAAVRPTPGFSRNGPIPRSRLVDPGLFVDGVVPISKRLTLNAGARTDFVYTNSQARLVSGNINITPGPQSLNNPLVPGQIPAPV